MATTTQITLGYLQGTALLIATASLFHARYTTLRDAVKALEVVQEEADYCSDGAVIAAYIGNKRVW